MRPSRCVEAVAAVLRTVIHDLAQPAASAALAVELATLEIDQQKIEQARGRLAVATQQLDALQSLLTLYAAAAAGRGAVAGGAPGITDPAVLVAESVPGALTRPCPPVAFPGDLLRLALARLARILGGNGLRCTAAPSRSLSAVLIRLSGQAGHAAALAPWIALLRSAGATVRLRSGSLVISLPYSASLDRANGDTHEML